MSPLMDFQPAKASNYQTIDFKKSSKCRKRGYGISTIFLKNCKILRFPMQSTQSKSIHIKGSIKKQKMIIIFKRLKEKSSTIDMNDIIIYKCYIYLLYIFM